MSEIETLSLSQVGAYVGKAEALLGKVCSALKACCLGENGKVSANKLDEIQLAAFDLAYTSAELTAASQTLTYAQQIESDEGQEAANLEIEIAKVYAAEVLLQAASRFWIRGPEWSVDEAEIQQCFNQEVRDFCRFYQSGERLAALGQVFLDNDGHAGKTCLDSEKEMMRNSFRQFATDVVSPLAEDIHRKDLIIPDEILKPLVELGCFGLSIPMRYGGIQPDEGEDNLGMIVVTEELSRGSLAGAGSLITRPEIVARALLKGGTEEQKQHWLPKVAVADPLCAIAVTEPNYGSDVANMRVKAVQVEGGWRISGAKTWCTFAGKAKLLLALARTNSDLSLGHKGLSLFLVEKPSTDGHDFEYEQPEGGKITGRAIATIGYRGMHSYEVFFDDFFVPDANVVGGEEGLGRGFYTIMAGFEGGRIQTAARASGVMEAAFEKSLTYAKDRHVFSKPIAEYPLTRVKLAKMGVYLCVMRQFTYAVAKLMDEGKGQMEASLVKLIACKTAEWVTREAMQIHGGMGYAEETAVSRYYVDARVLSIFEGAEETLALKVIARSLLQTAN